MANGLDENQVSHYDVKNQAQVSVCLVIIGNSLAYHPTNLTRLLEEAPDAEKIFMGAPPPWLRHQGYIISRYTEARGKKDMISIAEREYHLRQCLLLETFSPYHQWIYLLAPLWFEWVNRNRPSFELTRDKRVTRCLVALLNVTSIRSEIHLVYGYSALESMMTRNRICHKIDKWKVNLLCSPVNNDGFIGLVLGLVSYISLLIASYY